MPSTPKNSRTKGRIKRSNTISSLYSFELRYLPAVLKHNSHGWQVEYAVLNPETDQMEHKRMRLNVMRKRMRTLAEFKRAANEIIATINSRLAGGWTPFRETENTRYYTPLAVVLDAYIKDRARELRGETTMRSYRSFAKQFNEWLERTVPGCKCINFNRTLAVRFMDDYYTHVSERTYNNMLKMARAFYTWAIEKCYAKENPFINIRSKKAGEKTRDIIPAEYRTRIKDYFEDIQPEMVIVCQLVYTSLIRPIEIVRIKVSMLHLQDKYIEMPQDITKNGHRRVAPLSENTCRRLAQHIAHAGPDDYLFGREWLPSEEPIFDKLFRRRWDKMRKAINLPKEMQLYSLRDTGIFDKIKSGIDPLTVMQAADHHDLAMTTRYANHFDPNMVRIISEESPDF